MLNRFEASQESKPTYTSSFRSLGISDKVVCVNEVGQIQYSNIVPINKPKELAGVKELQDKYLFCSFLHYPYDCTDDAGELYSVLLLLGADKDCLQVIGYVDLHTSDNIEASIVDWGSAPKHIEQSYWQLPAYLQKAFKLIYDFDVDTGHLDGIEIMEEFRGKGLGKILWALGLGYLEELGIFSARIGADATEGRIKEGESFYSRFGAVTRLNTNSSYYNIIDGYRHLSAKRTLTHLTEEQEHVLALAFH